MSFDRFLILDNNAGNVLFFEMLLKELGVESVQTCPTGDDALIQADKNHIQFFISAWELNGMSGTVFIQKIRAKRKRLFAPCLIYSKRMSIDDVNLTHELGFPDLIAMPFERDKIKLHIQSILENEAKLDPTEKLLRKIEMYGPDQPMEAFKLFKESMFKEGPLQTRAYLSAALVHMNLGKFDKAEKCISDALKNEPKSSRGLQLHAKLLSRLGKHDEAISCLEQLHLQSPRNLGTKINLGSAYLQGDRLEDAKRIFGEVLKVDKDNQDCKDQLGCIAFKEGDITLAEQLIAETENGNELARMFNNLAISLVSKGEFERGIVTYLNAMRLLADKARLYLLHFNLGLAYKKKGDLELSFKAFADSYISEPSYEKAYSAIARMAQELKAQGKRPDSKLVAEIKSLRQMNTNTSQAS